MAIITEGFTLNRFLLFKNEETKTRDGSTHEKTQGSTSCSDNGVTTASVFTTG